LRWFTALTPSGNVQFNILRKASFHHSS
jgi:hypothetical protein